MTVSAAERPTEVAQSGSGGTWSGLSNLEYGDSGNATGPFGSVYLGWALKEVACGIPNFLTSVDHGSQFQSLKMTWKEYYTGPSNPPTSKAKLTGGDTINNGEIPSSERTVTLDGDADYWGLSGTAQEIFSGLKDGDITFDYTPDTAYSGSGVSIVISDVKFTLTYALADTKRAALIAVLP